MRKNEGYNKLSTNELWKQLLISQTKVFGAKEIELMLGFINERNVQVTNVVDIGCGTGHFLFELAKKYSFAHYTGIDNNDYMFTESSVLISENNIKNICVELLDVKNKETRQFIKDADVVYMRYTLQHIENRNLILQKIYDEMKPGSVFFGIEAVYPFYGEYPSGGVFSEYIDKFKQSYASTNSEPNMSIIMPSLLNKVGFHDVTMKIAFHSNLIAVNKKDFVELIMNGANLINRISPHCMDLDFIKKLEDHMDRNLDKTHMYKATAVIRGTKR